MTKSPTSLLPSALLSTVLLALSQPSSAQRLRVFVLAGQSNMQGHAKTSTFDYIGDDAATRPLLDAMRDDQGNPRVCDGCWISYLTHGGVCQGPLTAGYGARRDASQSDDKIGPEFTFGIAMDAHHRDPVLLIKTAWGGKSLHTDFRPPSAGAYVFRPEQLEQIERQGKDLATIRAEKEQATGLYYRLMIEHVRAVLADPGKVCPTYDPEQGYELAGFVWFQGWNDMVDRSAYPRRDQPDGYADYTSTLVHFVEDIRRDLQVPDLPFVIGVMGVDGIATAEDPKRTIHYRFQRAMAEVADDPRLGKRVGVVQTGRFWDHQLAAIDRKQREVSDLERRLRRRHKDTPNRDGSMSEGEIRSYVAEQRLRMVSDADLQSLRRGASNAGYHYLGSAKTMAQIGRGFAKALIEME
jgi:hypothetical protein